MRVEVGRVGRVGRTPEVCQLINSIFHSGPGFNWNSSFRYKGPPLILFSPRNSSSLFPPSHPSINHFPLLFGPHSFTSFFLPQPSIFSAFASDMSLTRIPLPSIALVLTSDYAALPSRPSVIKFEFDPLQTIHPTSSGRSRVLVSRYLFPFVCSGIWRSI